MFQTMPSRVDSSDAYHQKTVRNISFRSTNNSNSTSSDGNYPLHLILIEDFKKRAATTT